MLGVTSVSIASAAPQLGGSCKVAGKVRVTNTGTLKCERKGGSLRWTRVAAPSLTGTTVTATPIAVVSPVRAPQVADVSVDNSAVRFTISGMSPDTGVYAVQWVETGQSFNSYYMMRFVERNIVIGTSAFLGCGHSYTFRVFGMQTNWKLTDGHQTQNVTPHSTPFDVTFTHPCSTAVADEPLTCATGGTCAVGDTGPGGGTVFYVQASGTFSCGIGLNSTCKYLEFAPYGWNDGGDDPGIDWCSTGTDLDIDNTGIGSGLANTTKADDTCTSGAIQTVASYSNNGKGDWYLPSKAEVNELCKYARQQATGDSSVDCASTGSVRSGFRSAHYWSSTEISGTTNAWSSEFGYGNQLASNKVPGNLFVRPIRAFGGSTGCADGGTCAVGDTGPGGGKVFYVHTSGTFTSTGSTCGGSCKYLEVSNADQSAGIQWIPPVLKCFEAGSDIGVEDCSSGLYSIYSNSEGQATSQLASRAIGQGLANTNKIYARATTEGGESTSTYAAGLAWNYVSYGQTDWFLPSLNELNELCKYFYYQSTGDSSVMCSNSLWHRTEFAGDFYWSSSEVGADGVMIVDFYDGTRYEVAESFAVPNVRAIRAFG